MLGLLTGIWVEWSLTMNFFTKLPCSPKFNWGSESITKTQRAPVGDFLKE